MELSERKKKILKTIIDDYISTAMPVGSKTIAEHMGMSISSATVRNEMNELESMGYLDQPHTSAGRIPSDKAFRMYVDSLLEMTQLTAPEIAAKLGAVRIRRFVQSEAFAKICAAQQVLRELAFITALPAAEVLAAQGSPAPEAQVLVQGIADLVLVFPDHLELLDYKTDRRKSEDDFLAAYRAQLDLYALAISKRFAPKPVTYKGIYSLELGKLIEVK